MGAMKTTIRQMLDRKGDDVWAVTPGTTVFEALKLMAEKNIGAALVREGEDLVGIFSERDYARKVILHGQSSKDLAVRDIMTTRVVCIRPEQTADECMALMTERRVRHLPVVDEANALVGMVSIGDVVRAVISQQEFTIEQLEGYITSAN
jgi:CBS domain-containing protein